MTSLVGLPRAPLHAAISVNSINQQQIDARHRPSPVPTGSSDKLSKPVSLHSPRGAELNLRSTSNALIWAKLDDPSDQWQSSHRRYRRPWLIHQQRTDTPTQVIAIAAFGGTPLAGKREL